MYTFREVLQKDDKCWDDLVRISPQGNAFLLISTLQILAANEKPAARIWRVGAFKDDGTLAAGWAVLVRRRAGIRYCSSFPLFYAGPLLSPEWNDEKSKTKRMDLLKGLTISLQQGLDIMDTEAAPSLPDARGLVYAGCHAEQFYTHLWPACSSEELQLQLNRTKRQDANRSARRYVFEWKEADAETLEHFDQLHNQTLEKFKWVASSTWRAALLKNIVMLAKTDTCRIFAAASSDNPALPCAMVTVLLSPDHQCAWLWRVACQREDSGLIPALYLRAGEALKKEFGAEWTINFGGSPNLSLARFKDYLGAKPTPHWHICWQRPGIKSFLWNNLNTIKELFRRHLTLWKMIRPPHTTLHPEKSSTPEEN